ETPSSVPPAPSKAPPAPTTRATPVEAPPKKAAPATRAPKAGGGPTGGRGTDVATVQTAGIDFPFPGYLNNIVRQIALNFRVQNPNSPLSATMSFLIHRDGSVTDVKFVHRSGVYSFDLEAQGAIERASSSFGPLPDGVRRRPPRTQLHAWHQARRARAAHGFHRRRFSTRDTSARHRL